jgi:hypothetical protein
MAHAWAWDVRVVAACLACFCFLLGFNTEFLLAVCWQQLSELLMNTLIRVAAHRVI